MPTEPDLKSTLVVGATGRLGGIVERLLGRGHRVVAMSRDPGSEAALKLRRAGAALRGGDLEDVASIAAAASGVDTVFATGTAHRAGPEGELRHGLNLVEALVEAGGPQLVFVSGDGAAADSPVPLFRVKFAVEERIRESGIAHTILAPTYLMENLFNPWNLGALRSGTVPSPIPVDRPLQQTAITDLLALAVETIERTGRLGSMRLRVASDELSAEDAATALGKVLGRPFDARQVDRDRLAPALRALFAWLERTGHDLDLDALHTTHPEVGWHSFEQWAATQGARFRELCPQPVAAAH